MGSEWEQTVRRSLREPGETKRVIRRHRFWAEWKFVFWPCY